LRFLVRLASTELPRETLLASMRSLARSAGAEVRNPKWTSYGALELDIFCPSKADFDVFLSVIGPVTQTEFVHDLNVAPPYRTEDEQLLEARSLFNSERYWESHEVLEGIWKQKQGEAKRFLQAVILVCAAFVHHQKGEENVALGVLKRAEAQLGFPEDEYGGISVSGLRHNVERVLSSEKFSEFKI
jgi:hypothetical protein